MTDFVSLENAHSSGGVARRPVTIVRAAGSRLWDAQGREYIDLGGAHGWASLGHAHPKVTRAIQDQAAVLVTHTESSYNDQRALWFQELGQIVRDTLGNTGRGPMTRIHAGNSGAEAVEAAIKFARQATRRTDFVAAEGGFHGRTLGALSATAAPRYRKSFEPLVPGFRHVPLNDVAALEAAVTDRTAGVMLEAVQGEGGVRLATSEFLHAARRLCDERGALLILDEIQSGLGRTGKWFACQHAPVLPDIIAIGKPLGGGIPMGAAVWREGLGTFETGTHAGTFGANPLACAAGRAVLRVICEEGLVERAATLGGWLLDQLRGVEAPAIREVRGLGLMVGIELTVRVTPILKELMRRGVWAIPAGERVLRLLPPLTIPQEDLERGVAVVREVLRAA